MANYETIGVSLKFSADVSAAKRAMSELQGQLTQISNMQTGTHIGTQFASQLGQAQHAATQLRIALQHAFNIDTGKLNLTKFNQQMQSSGMTLEKYRSQLMAIGSQGEQAFNKLAFSIATAETPVFNLSKGIQRLGTTFMNTMRYQLSASIIMGFVQSISEAVDYTKELNESLNNIRIVTNYGVEEMKEFAKEANKAAKALSTTTTAMTDASLIYFQQGLNMKEAQQRAETTIKLANITGQSVETVSDQLTAIWNNFYDGTKSLEYYADVLTALGAATASSSDEISEGLEKFAAIANTVGLSYEYATAALATVTATTRQSADVVGTAFKTLFARIQDLELGKELEDGVTLGQYSEGLATIGVNVLDTNGNLKDMNDILDEIGQKWGTLSKAQQVSVAQTVAGVRQYSQLIALMDNWSYFQENLNTATTSTGALQEQQDIYAESWEAASQRVTAALETIYDKLLNDEFFIDALDTFTSFLEMIDKMIDGLGGLPGVLSLVATALLRAFGPQIASGVQTVANGVYNLTLGGKKKLQDQQLSATEHLRNKASQGGMEGLEASSLSKQAGVAQTRTIYGKQMSEYNQAVFDTEINDMIRTRENYLASDAFKNNKRAVKDADLARNILSKQETSLKDQVHKAIKKSGGLNFTDVASIEAVEKELKDLGITATAAKDDISAVFGPDEIASIQKYLSYLEQIKQHMAADKTWSPTRGQKGQITKLAKAATSGPNVFDRDTILNEGVKIRQGVASQHIQSSINVGTEQAFNSIAEAKVGDTSAQIQSLDEMESRLRNFDVGSTQFEDRVGKDRADEYVELRKKIQLAKEALEEFNKEAAKGNPQNLDKLRDSAEAAMGEVNQLSNDIQKNSSEMVFNAEAAAKNVGATDNFIVGEKLAGEAVGETAVEMMHESQAAEQLDQRMKESTRSTMDFGQKMQLFANTLTTVSMVVSTLKGLWETWTQSDEDVSFGDKLLSSVTSLVMVLPMAITLINDQTKSFLLNAGGADKTAIANYLAGQSAQEAGLKAKASTIMWKGLGKTLGKFAIYAAAIAVVVTVVSALAKAADDARNSAENFAASAAQGAKDAAEAYSKATAAFNELKQSIESYENALTGLQKLTQGTNEYKQALFDANEQALALVQSHAGLKYYIDSNGLIVFDESELDRIEAEAQQKKADAYSAKLSADRSAREAAIENQKVQLGRKLKGQDFERNDEDDAATLTGASVGAGAGGIGLGIAATSIAGALAAGGKIGATAGTVLGGPVGTLVGAALGVLVGGAVGAIAGTIASEFDNDATSQEKEAMDALYEAYKEQGDSALTEKGIREALSEVGIDNENLILSLAENKDATKDLMKAMEANTAAIEAETLMAATQQAHALDATLQYRDSNAQNAITKALARERTNAEKASAVDPNSYRSKQLFGAWYNVAGDGKEDFEAYLREEGLGDQVNKIYDKSNFSDDHIEYEYIDENGDTQKKKLTYAQLAAWKTAKSIDAVSNKSYDNIVAAINSAQEFFGDNSEGLLSVIGGQDLVSLSEQEFKDFKSAFNTGKYDEYIINNAEALGYESGDAFKRAISESIANYDPEKAFAQFSKQINTEIDGILQAGAEETKYTTGALESYTEALAENNEALHDNADEWKNLEKKKFAAQAAVANAKFVKGVDALTKVLEDNLEILLKWDEASLDTYEAADKVQTALEDVFGVRVSADFIKNNLADIQKLAQGSTEKLEELSRAAAVDFVLNIDTLSESSKKALEGAINELSSKKIEIGADIEDKAFIRSLNAMLSQGEITAEQIQQAFGAVGYAPDIKYRTDKQKTTTKHYIYDNGDINSKPRIVIQETETDIRVPYIAGEGTQSMATGDKGSQENGSGITKMRDVGSIGASLSDTKKQNTDKLKELDRYHEFKEELADIERSLDKISKAKDRAFGKAKLDLIDQEIKQQEKLIEAEQKYYEEIQKNYKFDLQALDSRFQLDENGRIKNYTEVLQNLINSGISGDVYDEIKESADQYEETLNLLEEQQEKVNDETLKMKDLALEKIEYEVKIKVHFDDREIKRLEHLLKNLEDFSYDNAKKSIDLLGQMAQRNINTAKAYLEGINKVLGESLSEEQQNALSNLLQDLPSQEELPNALSNILGDTQITVQQKEDIENYIDSLYTEYEDLSNFYEGVMEQINTAFENMNENSEKAISRVEQLGKTLENYQNIIDLVGKKSLGITNEQIRALGRAQVEQVKTNLQILQGQLEINEAALQSAKDKRDAAETAGDAEAVKYWDEQIETIQDKVWALEGEVESAWADALQTIADDFVNAVETATSAFEESMTGIYGSYEKMQEVFNQQKEIGDRYVDDYKKIYELSKLNRDLNKSIDQTDSVKGKQALRDLQEEINELQESDTQMNEYDLEYLRKKYELRVAEIALEEAQNAKSQVRMQRDAEGNWSYVYTADESKIDSAQQNYENKLYALQDFAQQHIDEMQELVITAEREMVEALNALGAEDFATQEEYQAEVTRITKYYTGMRNYALDELNKAIDNSKYIYENDWSEYNKNTDYKISKEGDWRQAFKDTELAMVTGFPNIESYRSAFDTNMTDMMDRLTKAFKDWEIDVKETFRLVGQDFDNFGGENGTLDKKVKDIAGKLNEVSEKFKGWKNDAEIGFKGIIKAATDQFIEFSKKISDYKSQIDTITAALTAMLELAGIEVPAPGVEIKTKGTEGNTQGGNSDGLGYYQDNQQEQEDNDRIKEYEVKGEEISREDQSATQGTFKFSKENLASAKRTTDWSEYFTIIAHGKEYRIHEDEYIKALLASGQSELYSDKKENPFNRQVEQQDLFSDSLYKINQNVRLKEDQNDATRAYTWNGTSMNQDSIFAAQSQTAWNEDGPLSISDIKKYNGKYYYYIQIPNTTTAKWFAGEQLEEFNTGGYTGSWDSSGRLAMLHQKEIVLNAHDTENFLAAIDIVRDIVSVIDLRAAAQQSALSQMVATSVAPTVQTLQQEVTIHAEFPNATQRTEIEAAFDTLLNRASQFANRKNK